MKLAWGKKLSKEFIDELCKISKALRMNPSNLTSCIAFETGETFSPTVLNTAGSGAIGLIQFMPSTAQALGTDTYRLSKMTAVQQLDYVYKYFRPKAGKLITLSDVYMTILWPVAVGKPENYVLFDKNDPNHPKRYIQNKGLDFNKDGLITKEEATMAVKKKYDKGMLPENCLEINYSEFSTERDY